MRNQRPADMSVHLDDVFRPRGGVAADRPQGFVTDGTIGAGQVFRHAVFDLAGAKGQGLAGVAIGLRFADADKRHQAGRVGGRGLGGDLGVGFAIGSAAFGVADDHGGGAVIPQHLGADLAGEGARDLGVAILAADGQPALGRFDGAVDQGGWRADQDIDIEGRGPGRGGDRPDLAELRLQAVHLPVSGDQGAHGYPL